MSGSALPPRSRLKRFLKGALAAVTPPDPRPGLIILVYHKVGSPLPAELNCTLPAFRRQMEHLARHYRVLPLTEALQRLAEGASPGREMVALTFDDGYRNFHTHAYPVLRALNLTATVYVCPQYVRAESPMPWDRDASEAVMGWSALRELADDGLVTVGSHTWSHRVLVGLSPKALSAELRDARLEIEQRLGRPAPDFCYPKSLRDAAGEAAVRRTYATAVIGGHRKVVPPADPHRLHRIPVVGSDTFALFRAKLEGRLRAEGRLAEARNLLRRVTGTTPRY